MKLDPIPWADDLALRRVAEVLEAADIPLRLVGGCVRDAIMQRPLGDLDLCSPAPPERTQAALEPAGIKVVPTGLAHGTITAVVDGTAFEITSLRRDLICDGRHAEIAYTDDWQADARRRDFTMNAIYADIRTGELYDDVGGIADARAGRLRFIGDAAQRIEEDALRILRYFRFFATHSTDEPDADALAACAAKRTMIAGLSAERIQQEMRRLLRAVQPDTSLLLMKNHQIDSFIFGFTINLETFAKSAHFYEEIESIEWLRLALICRASGADAVRLVRKWKLSNQQSDLVMALVNHPTLAPPQDETTMIRQARRLSEDVYPLLLVREAVEQDWEVEQTISWIRAARALTLPRFPLRGDDLLQAGVPAGSKLGATLRQLEERWEQSGFSLGRDALLAQLVEIASEGPER